MSNSCKVGSLNPPFGSCSIPARTAGPLGFQDHGDTDITTLLGDTPGALGFNDWGEPAGGRFGFFGRGFVCHAADGAAVAPSTTAVSTLMTWEDIQADFKEWEALITYMYLDTRGFVTVGVGNMLPNAAAAQALAFVKRKDGAAATAAEIKTEYDKVAALDFGNYKATWYKDKTTLDLPEVDCWRLLKKRVDDEFLPALKDEFTGWDELPVVVKRALLDMAFNLGMGDAKKGSGLRGFKKLKTSVEAADWKKAATQCHRSGPSDDRNNWTRDLFLKAAEQKK